MLLSDRYHLTRKLGRGGMGEVYEAVHRGTGQSVAVKRVLQGDASGVRLRREALAIRTVSSPHIVKVLDSGVEAPSGNPFLVMELLTGQDLSAVLRRAEPLPVALAVRIAMQVCEGLAAAHRMGVIHRDIKPANLFLAHDGDDITVKIVDFGIARAVRVDETPSGAQLADELTQLTRTNFIVGSPTYMAPEQVRGLKSVDQRSDIWSLGVVLYRMLTGRAPHARGEGGVGELLLSICCTQPVPVRTISPHVPERLADIVHTALQLDPAHRYPDADTMLEALRTMLPSPRIERAAWPVLEALHEAGEETETLTRGTVSTLEAATLSSHESFEPSSAAWPMVGQPVRRRGVRRRLKIGAAGITVFAALAISATLGSLARAPSLHVRTTALSKVVATAPPAPAPAPALEPPTPVPEPSKPAAPVQAAERRPRRGARGTPASLPPHFTSDLGR